MRAREGKRKWVHSRIRRDVGVPATAKKVFFRINHNLWIPQRRKKAVCVFMSMCVCFSLIKFGKQKLGTDETVSNEMDAIEKEKGRERGRRNTHTHTERVEKIV